MYTWELFASNPYRADGKQKVEIKKLGEGLFPSYKAAWATARKILEDLDVERLFKNSLGVFECELKDMVWAKRKFDTPTPQYPFDWDEFYDRMVFPHKRGEIHETCGDVCKSYFLRSCDLNGFSLYGGNLEGIDFQGTRGINAINANLQNSDLFHSTIIDCRESDIRGARIDGMKIPIGYRSENMKIDSNQAKLFVEWLASHECDDEKFKELKLHLLNFLTGKKGE